MNDSDMPGAMFDRPPRHRHEMVLRLGADTWDGLTNEIHHVADYLDQLAADADTFTSSTSSAGWHIEFEHDPQMDAERYRIDLGAWAKRRRDERRAALPRVTGSSEGANNA